MLPGLPKDEQAASRHDHILALLSHGFKKGNNFLLSCRKEPVRRKVSCHFVGGVREGRPVACLIWTHVTVLSQLITTRSIYI